MNHVLIPSNLDIDKFIQDLPPRIDKFDRDKLLILVNLIGERESIFRRSQNEHNLTREQKWRKHFGFVNIHSSLLQKVVHNYRRYIDYLKSCGLIEVDEQFIEGELSRGYKLSEKFNSDLVIVNLNSSNIAIRTMVKKEQFEDKYRARKVSFLSKWLNSPLFTFDFDLACSYLKKNRQSIEQDEDDMGNAYRNALYNMHRIKEKDFYFLVDDTSLRLHTNLVNLNKKLRPFFKYDSNDLVNIDISSSQPYLAIILLNPSFYKPYQKINLTKLGITKIPEAEIKGILRDPPLTLENDENYTKYLDTKKYIELVTGGTFYEYFEQECNNQLGISFSNRQEVKQEVLRALYSDNIYYNQRGARPKMLLSKLFPSIYEVFRSLKEGGKNRVAIILQRIESYLVLEVVCKQINRKFPNIPLFTIHDSVATTVEFKDVVYQEMYNTLSESVGYPPNLKVENWVLE